MSLDLENWMTNLSTDLRRTPIIHLAIPGSHDSGTYGITAESKVAPDADPILAVLSNYVGCIAKPIISKWSITQESNIRQQLYYGIRYFDLRLATRKDRDQYYVVHGMFGEDVCGIFTEMLAFLNSHPQEMIILDCQHFYAFEEYDHRRFMEILIGVFSSKIIQVADDMTDVTLEFTTEKSAQQVLVIYREAPFPMDSNFWPTENYPNPWADTMSAPDLITFLSQGIIDKDQRFGFVSQCILTPTSSTILSNVCSNLQEQCFIPLEEEKYKWLEQQVPGPNGVNVIISDFAEYEDDEFTKTVILLNEKILF